MPHKDSSSETARVSKKARISLIGTGWWATYAHLPALVERTDVEVVALANRSEGKLRTAAEAFNVTNTYTDYREMLDREQLDGVVVAASHAIHFEAAKAALEHDCHVLAEKPLTLCASEARELVDIAKKRNRAIVMSCPWSFTPHSLRAREVLRSGELGEIQFVSSLFTSWAYETYRGDQKILDDIFSGDIFGDLMVQPRRDANIDPKKGGGQGWCQVSHSAALLFWVTGLTAQKVSAYMDRLDLQVDVVDAISMKLSNGALGVLGSTGNVLPMGDPGQHGLWVYGSRGQLALDVVAGTLVIKKCDKTVESLPPLTPEERYPRFAPANNFVDVILNGAENLAPGEIGCCAVEFIEASHESAAKDGVPVVLET